MYDLYLSAGCHSTIDIRKFAFSSSPELISDLDVLVSKEHPEFLSLSLDWKTAHELMLQLKLCGARGLVIETKYREPVVTLEQATRIAEEALAKMRKSHPNVQFEPVKFLRGQHHPMWWTFGCVGQEWVKAGVIPGMLSASVDKVDGRIWSQDDMRRFHESQE